MENNELDKIIKEKLQGKIEPTPEFEKRIETMVKQERDKKLQSKFEQVKKEQ